MSKLALLGGNPVISEELPIYQSISEAEEKQVMAVLKSGCISGFYGSWREGFMGGAKIQEFEGLWQDFFKIKHAITVNSNTSGLIAALGAVGISPGDEVIIPPLSMSATAIAPLFYGGIPVFVDVDEDTFCLDYNLVEQEITPKTRAIIAVNLLGQAAPLRRLRELADRHGIYLIEDNAQGLMAKEFDIFCGTIGHIGVFSLNYHKHIHTGEGGVCVTNDNDLAMKMRLIRNHAENIVEPAKINDITNMIGFNFRMTELSAALGIAQLESIDEHVGRRQHIAIRLSEGTSGLDGLTSPHIRQDCVHAYYCWFSRYKQNGGPPRQIFQKALQAEGVPTLAGYVKPLYHLPVFQQRKAIGRDGYPFTLTDRKYHKDLCPVAENLHKNELIGFETCQYEMDDENLNLIIEAYRKVSQCRDELINYEAS